MSIGNSFGFSSSGSWANEVFEDLSLSPKEKGESSFRSSGQTDIPEGKQEDSDFDFWRPDSGLEAEMPEEFDFEEDSVSEEEMPKDPQQRLQELSQKALSVLRLEAFKMETIKDFSAAKTLRLRAGHLEDALLGKREVLPFSQKRKMFLDLDEIPDVVHLAVDHELGRYRGLLVNKAIQAIESYQKEDRIQACTIFLSKMSLTLPETVDFLVRLQKREGKRGPQSDALNYSPVAENSHKIPPYATADEDLQKRMDQFLIDADRRRVAAQQRTSLR